MQFCLESWCHGSYIIIRRVWWWVDSNDIKTITDVLKEYHSDAAYFDHHNMRKDGKFFLYICCIASVQKQIESTRKRTYMNNNWRKKIQWLKIYIRWTLRSFSVKMKKGKRGQKVELCSLQCFSETCTFEHKSLIIISLFSRRLQHSAFASSYCMITCRLDVCKAAIYVLSTFGLSLTPTP